jgi:hypothetical protein
MKQADISCEESIIQSLCYLYQEALKASLHDIAHVIQDAVDGCERIMGNEILRSRNCDALLKQFYVLREFQKLDERQKELFIQKIEYLHKAEDTHKAATHL